MGKIYQSLDELRRDDLSEMKKNCGNAGWYDLFTYPPVIGNLHSPNLNYVVSYMEGTDKYYLSAQQWMLFTIGSPPVFDHERVVDSAAFLEISYHVVLEMAIDYYKSFCDHEMQISHTNEKLWDVNLEDLRKCIEILAQVKDYSPYSDAFCGMDDQRLRATFRNALSEVVKFRELKENKSR